MPYEGVDPKGADIEQLRVARGWSRKELGSRVRIDYKTVWGIERGGQRSTRETLQRIATEFGVALADVMKDDNPPPKRGSFPTPAPQPTRPTPPPRPTKSPTRVTGSAA